MRDVILRFDFCAYPTVFVAVFLLARTASQFRPRFAPAMAWTAIAVFLAVAAIGYGEVRPPQDLQVLAILVCSGIAACVGALIVFVVLTPAAAMADRLAKEAERTSEARQLAKARADKRERDELELRRLAEAQELDRARERSRDEWHRLHPPPTREDHAAEAKARYDGMLRMIDAAGLDPTEDRAARAEAKQRYLHELDAIWKRS